MDVVVINGVKYNAIDRIAHVGDLIFTTPDKFNHNIHDRFDIPYDTPFEVYASKSTGAYFRNEGTGFLDRGWLAHAEYLVLEYCAEENNRPIRIKIGDSVVEKKFLGVTFYKKTTSTYSYHYEEDSK